MINDKDNEDFIDIGRCFSSIKTIDAVSEQVEDVLRSQMQIFESLSDGLKFGGRSFHQLNRNTLEARQATSIRC